MDCSGPGIASATFITGMKMEEHSFTWKIENFPVLRKQDKLIEAQKIDLEAGDSVMWTLCLVVTKEDEKKWIGVHYALKTKLLPTSKYLYSQVVFDVKCKEHWKRVNKEELDDIVTLPVGTWVGHSKMIEANAHSDQDLVIHVTFKLYLPSEPIRLPTLQPTFEEFQDKFALKARRDLAGLLQAPLACDNIKIISSDNKEFSAQKGILAVRSSVFERMLKSDMSEAKTGIIQLSDISSNTLEVLLNYIYTGELLPDWSRSGVIVELTNAAAEYHLTDLLAFLDVMLGKVADLQNVVTLLNLATQLSLKTAREELFKFVQEKGVSSQDHFFQMLKSI